MAKRGKKTGEKTGKPEANRGKTGGTCCEPTISTVGTALFLEIWQEWYWVCGLCGLCWKDSHTPCGTPPCLSHAACRTRKNKIPFAVQSKNLGFSRPTFGISLNHAMGGYISPPLKNEPGKIPSTQTTSYQVSSEMVGSQ